MSKYNRKQKTPKEDEFISFWARFFNAVAPYARAIGITLATAVGIWFAVWGFQGWREGKAEKAAEMFGRAVKIYDSELLGDQPPPKTEEENAVPRFKTAKERADAAVAELDKLDKQHGGSAVAKNAVVFRAGVLYDQGKFDEAATLYNQYLASGAKDGTVVTLAREGAALCDEARGKLDDALAKYKALEPKGAKNDFYRDRALFSQARVYVKKGDKKKAAELYKEVLTKVPATPLRDEIQNQLTQIEGT
jgi:hypothetical protein